MSDVQNGVVSDAETQKKAFSSTLFPARFFPHAFSRTLSPALFLWRLVSDSMVCDKAATHQRRLPRVLDTLRAPPLARSAGPLPIQEYARDQGNQKRSNKHCDDHPDPDWQGRAATMICTEGMNEDKKDAFQNLQHGTNKLGDAFCGEQ